MYLVDDYINEQRNWHEMLVYFEPRVIYHSQISFVTIK